jgi:hypothetical protein
LRLSPEVFSAGTSGPAKNKKIVQKMDSNFIGLRIFMMLFNVRDI